MHLCLSASWASAPHPGCVLRPQLRVQILALGCTYFVAVSALDVITNVGTIDDLTSLARMLLVLPVAALDGVFILWVFTSLSRTLNQLQARRNASKLELYRCAHCAGAPCVQTLLAGSGCRTYLQTPCTCCQALGVFNLAPAGRPCVLHARPEACRVREHLQTAHVAGSLCRRFTNTLAIMVWLSVAWIAYEMYYKVRGAWLMQQARVQPCR